MTNPMDFEKELNPAQLEAVMTTDGPVLVIAGAGSGKTRTIVYRLARLVSLGVDPASILLLTFTRKAAQEMLHRAGYLLSAHPDGAQSLAAVSGGTFHAFAFSVLRRHSRAAGFEAGFTIMDRPDAEDVVAKVKDQLGLGKGDRSFPKKGTVCELISKARNKETDVPGVLQREAYHLLPHADDLAEIATGYHDFKRAHGLLDYDDLLFMLEKLLRENEELRAFYQSQFRYLMVDEYQDTNLVQARLTALLAGERGNIMAVGDDAQSIYAFRGANVENILHFPRIFPGTKIIKLERNYRSTQPILSLTNAILKNAGEKFDKTLFTERQDGGLPELVRPFSDMTQAKLAVAKVKELAGRYPLHEIAVLFRAGYQSFSLEVELNKAGVPFQKFGGQKFSEAAHIKDAVAYLRVLHNPGDLPGWLRILAFVPKVGPKTANLIFEAVQKGDHAYLDKQTGKSPALLALFNFLDAARAMEKNPAQLLERVVAFHAPLLMDKYPDDYPRRQTGLEQLVQIAAGYHSLEAFLADMVIEDPEQDRKAAKEDHLVLSTVHSSKGLEWSAVLLIDLVDERFPSRHALSRAEDMEEERRLLYVACTRARDHLSLFAPETLYSRQNGGCATAMQSVFLRELPPGLSRELRESIAGGLSAARSGPDSCFPSFAASGRANASPGPLAAAPQPPSAPRTAPQKLGYCTHKVFGRGKIVADLGGGKVKINFPGFGLKVILSDYIQMEE